MSLSRAVPPTEHLSKWRVRRFTMIANRIQRIAMKTVGRKPESDPSAWLAGVGNGVVILAFGAAWFVFLRGLTAVGRMLMVWHFNV